MNGIEARREKRAKPLRWGAPKHDGSQMRSAASYELRRAGVVYAKVQKTNGGWFAYSLQAGSFNTHSEPTSLDEAKKYAEQRIRIALAETAARGFKSGEV